MIFFFSNRCREIVRLKIPYIPDPPFMGLTAVAGEPQLFIGRVSVPFRLFFSTASNKCEHYFIIRFHYFIIRFRFPGTGFQEPVGSQEPVSRNRFPGTGFQEPIGSQGPVSRNRFPGSS
jgi:hypothetical protein